MWIGFIYRDSRRDRVLCWTWITDKTLSALSQRQSMSSTAVNAKPVEVAKPGKPVDLLQSQVSLLYANLHPVLLLSLIPLGFKSLVQDPVNTLLGLAPTVALVQALYCVLCLPSTGQTPSPKSKPGQKTKTSKPAQDVWAKVVVRPEIWPIDVIRKLTLSSSASVPLLRAHFHPIGTSPLHNRDPFRRTTGLASPAYPSTVDPLGTPYNATAILRSRP